MIVVRIIVITIESSLSLCQVSECRYWAADSSYWGIVRGHVKQLVRNATNTIKGRNSVQHCTWRIGRQSDFIIGYQVSTWLAVSKYFKWTWWRIMVPSIFLFKVSAFLYLYKMLAITSYHVMISFGIRCFKMASLMIEK